MFCSGSELWYVDGLLNIGFGICVNDFDILRSLGCRRKVLNAVILADSKLLSVLVFSARHSRRVYLPINECETHKSIGGKRRNKYVTH